MGSEGPGIGPSPQFALWISFGPALTITNVTPDANDSLTATHLTAFSLDDYILRVVDCYTQRTNCYIEAEDPTDNATIKECEGAYQDCMNDAATD